MQNKHKICEICINIKMYVCMMYACTEIFKSMQDMKDKNSKNTTSFTRVAEVDCNEISCPEWRA